VWRRPSGRARRRFGRTLRSWRADTSPVRSRPPSDAHAEHASYLPSHAIRRAVVPQMRACEDPRSGPLLEQDVYAFERGFGAQMNCCRVPHGEAPGSPKRNRGCQPGQADHAPAASGSRGSAPDSRVTKHGLRQIYWSSSVTSAASGARASARAVCVTAAVAAGHQNLARGDNAAMTQSRHQEPRINASAMLTIMTHEGQFRSKLGCSTKLRPARAPRHLAQRSNSSPASPRPSWPVRSARRLYSRFTPGSRCRCARCVAGIAVVKRIFQRRPPFERGFGELAPVHAGHDHVGNRIAMSSPVSMIFAPPRRCRLPARGIKVGSASVE